MLMHDGDVKRKKKTCYFIMADHREQEIMKYLVIMLASRNL